MQQPDDYQTIDGRCRAADAALLAATRSARARARERWSAPHKIDSVVGKRSRSCRSEGGASQRDTRTPEVLSRNGLDLFGAPRREGSGAYGQFQIIQVPRAASGDFEKNGAFDESL